MSGVFVGEAEGARAVHAVATKTAASARVMKRRIREGYGCRGLRPPVPAELTGGGAALLLGLRRVLGEPLARRRAEPLVVDVLGDRGVLSADRALRVAPQPHLAERRVQSVKEEIAADEGLSDPEKELEGLVRLDRPDDSGKHAEDTRLRARRRELRWRRLVEQAAIARAFEGFEHGDLPLEPVDGAVDHRLAPLDRRVVQQVTRWEVVGAVDGDVVVPDDPVDVLGGEALLVRDDGHVRIDRLERGLRRIRLWLSNPLGRMA